MEGIFRQYSGFMHLFISTYNLKVDDKGRVSVPYNWRAIISEMRQRIYSYMSFNNQCIEVYTTERLELMHEYISNLDLFSQERDMLSTAVLASSEELTLDSKGRIMLSEHFLAHANIKNEAVFVGKGQTFEIWNKENFSPYFRQSREHIKKNNNMRAKPNASTPHNGK